MVIKLILQLILFFLADNKDARNLRLKYMVWDLRRMQSIGLHRGKSRQECNHVGQHCTAQGVQRNLLSTGGTLRTILGNKEEREKKTEKVDRATKLPSLSYHYTHQQ